MDQAVETIGPTDERIRHASGCMEVPEIGRERVRRAYRMVSLPVRMHEQGQISDHCLAAFERFEGDWDIANRVPSAIGAYGERRASADTEGTAEIRKVNARSRVDRALQAIPSPYARQALTMSVSPKDGGGPHTLEDIGRTLGYANRPQAMAHASATLRDVLYALHLHYDAG